MDSIIIPGILPIQRIRQMVQSGMITSDPDHPISMDQFQPNSLDLRLGTMAYRVRCSFLPENELVSEKLKKLTQHSFSIENGAILEPNCTYIIPLLEQVHLPTIYTKAHAYKAGHRTIQPPFTTTEALTAKTNPKSSTGRLDIFTRVITDFSHRFEEISAGYSGSLYLEVVPKSFPVRVRTGQRLNQLRVRHGSLLVSDQDIVRHHRVNPLLFDDEGLPLPVQQLKVGNGLFMSVSMAAREGEIIGYKARKNRDIVDLDLFNTYHVSDFWDTLYARKDDFVILEPEAFYIFASRERVRIPGSMAAEMVPYDTGSGELRTHYAGFFDSGFGGDSQDTGAKAVLEVRIHDVPFLVEHGQTMFRMVFEPNTEIPDTLYGKSIRSNYQGQELKLSKHFIHV